MTLKELQNKINRIYEKVKGDMEKTYKINGLVFSEKCLESVSGDIHQRALGEYLEEFFVILTKQRFSYMRKRS